jgi:hypothetical protein
MMDGYIDFLEKLFPAIDPYTAVRAKEAVREFGSHYDVKTPYFTKPLNEDFQQGDIFSKVPFAYISSKGIGKVILTGGMLLTNSCDAIRSKRLQFAAMFPLSEYSADPERQKAIKSNTNYDYLYFPDTVVSDYFINFVMIIVLF